MGTEGAVDRPPPPPPPDPPREDYEAAAIVDEGGGAPSDIVERHPADQPEGRRSAEAAGSLADSTDGQLVVFDEGGGAPADVVESRPADELRSQSAEAAGSTGNGTDDQLVVADEGGGAPPDLAESRTRPIAGDDSTNAMLRDNISAFTEEREILRSQGNEEGVAAMNAQIASARELIGPEAPASDESMNTVLRDNIGAFTEQRELLRSQGDWEGVAAMDAQIAAAEKLVGPEAPASDESMHTALRDNISAFAEQREILRSQGNQEGVAAMNAQIASARELIGPESPASDESMNSTLRDNVSAFTEQREILSSQGDREGVAAMDAQIASARELIGPEAPASDESMNTALRDNISAFTEQREILSSQGDREGVAAVDAQIAAAEKLIGSEASAADIGRGDALSPDNEPIHVEGVASSDSRLRDSLDHPDVRSALEMSWDNSQVDDPINRHEEGGWIISDSQTGESRIVPVASGVRDGINARDPGELGPSESVEAFYHTHPNPESDEIGQSWTQGPSDTDKAWSDRNQVPLLVRSADGYHIYYPDATGRLP